MKPHIKLYLTAYNYDVSSYIPCEMCGNKASDIHHIESRGMGGTKKPDRIENLMALCRPCHNYHGDIKRYKSYIYKVHMMNMIFRGVEFDHSHIKELIEQHK